jgi:alpha-1,4-digalacturonate transport system permease protein
MAHERRRLPHPHARPRRFDWTDWLSWAYLAVGLFLMFGPVLWLVMSSFKTEAALRSIRRPSCRWRRRAVVVAGLRRAAAAVPRHRRRRQRARAGADPPHRPDGQMVDPADPSRRSASTSTTASRRELQVRAGENYTVLFGKFAFGRYLWNSVFITVVATIITLLFNSMAAFALSKYKFRGRTLVFLLIIATLMIPPTINLVPIFLVISRSACSTACGA